jgi:hypothetical protein
MTLQALGWDLGKAGQPWGILAGWEPSSVAVPDNFFHSSPQWREERFRQTSESTNQRVLWWSILQTLILVAIGVWQMRHLKSFFEAKKLV